MAKPPVVSVPPVLAARERAIAHALARRARPAIIAYALLAVVIPVCTSYGDRHPAAVLACVAVAALLTFLRLRLVDRLADVASASRWARQFRGLALAAAGVWGLAFGLALVAGGPAEDARVFMIATAAMAMAALTTFAADGLLQRLYPALLVGPGIVALAATAERGAGTPALVLTSTVFLVFALFVARILNEDFLAALAASELLEQRAVEVDLARQRAEAADEAKSRLLVDVQRSYALAQAASQAKSDFLANVSHEIRTPLTAILGYADLLRAAGRMEDGERCAHAAVVRRNGEQLLGLLSDVLDLSKIEAGKMTVETAPAHLGEVLDDVVTLMSARAAEKKLSLALVRQMPLPDVIVTDALRLRQILTNLVANAIKFTDTGSVRIEAASRLEGDRTRLHIAVVDTGIGMSDAQASELFQPFAQVDASATRRFGGTGLGLVISRRFARMLGGDVTCASAIGKGSTFTLQIDAGPAAQPGVALEAPPAAEAARRATPSTGLEGLRVLLAEDSPDNQRLFALHLRHAGLEVDVARDGGEARDKALQAVRDGRPYVVVLMDMQMPGVDGYAATAELRATGYERRIVALTANAMKGDRQRCLDAGCDDYLTKPIGKKELVGAVVAARVAEDAGTAKEAPAVREPAPPRPSRSLGDPTGRDLRPSRELEATCRGGAGPDEAGPQLSALLSACERTLAPAAA